MKFIFTIIFFIVKATALPSSDEIQIDFRDERSVSSDIKRVMEDVSQNIKDAGLDPLYIEKHGYSYKLPVPVLFNSAVFVEELFSNGMSNIVVNSVSYSLLSSRLKFDMEMPLIDLRVGNASADTTVFGNTFKMESSGKVEVQRMRVVGHVRVNPNLITGITIRSVKITFTMGGIESDVKLIVQDEDYSDKVNEFLNTTVPETFKAYSSEINELFEIYLMDYITQYMKT